MPSLGIMVNMAVDCTVPLQDGTKKDHQNIFLHFSSH
jgi:hypothetical protein